MSKRWWHKAKLSTYIVKRLGGVMVLLKVCMEKNWKTNTCHWDQCQTYRDSYAICLRVTPFCLLILHKIREDIKIKAHIIFFAKLRYT